MIIANPIFDVIFKYMIQDLRIAKFFIGTLLQKNIESVTFQHHERAYHSDQLVGVRLYRFDFSAVIVEDNGEKTNVLIELQKAHKATDIERFRNYVAENYKKHNDVTIEGEVVKEFLHIYSIYILGEKLPDLPFNIVNVSRQYIDMDTGNVIETRSKFVEMLTHDCIVIQIPGLNIKVQKHLKELLSIFEQEHFIDITKLQKEYFHQVESTEMRYLLSNLEKAMAIPEVREQLELEQEAIQEYQSLNSQITRAKEREDDERRQKEDERRQKEEALQREEDERRQKEDAQLEIMIFKLNRQGKTEPEIAKELNISLEFVNKVLQS